MPSSFFDEIDELFEREFRNLLRMLRSFPTITPEQAADPLKPRVYERNGVRTLQWGPIIYGRTTIVGPDGRTITKEWSNLPQGRLPESQPASQSCPSCSVPRQAPPSELPSGVSEPGQYMADLTPTGDGGYLAILETPAASHEEVEAILDGRRLQVLVHGSIIRELQLPAPMEVEDIQFSNGVVEIRLRPKEGVRVYRARPAERREPEEEQRKGEEQDQQQDGE